MSNTLSVRLSEFEVEALHWMTHNGQHGAESCADFIRLLIHREFNRRKGRPRPTPSEWQGVYRVRRKNNLGSNGSPSADGGCLIPPHTVASPALSPTSGD